MPTTPYLVYGTITDESSSVVANTIITAYNATNQERTSFTSNSLGQYVLDLANLSSGYTDGDSITIYARNNGYTGETTFTLSGEGGILKNFSTSNQVTLSTIRNTSWKAFYDTLQTGTYAISTDSIYSAMNDQIIKDVGYPIVIIFPPVVSRDGMTLPNAQVECDVNFMLEIYHTSSENVKILTDNVENQIWRAQEIWSGIGLYGLNMPTSSHDWYTEGNKKIHRMTLNANFKFEGVVDIL